MECASYFDNSLPIFIFFLIGLLIGIIIVIIVWVVYIYCCPSSQATKNTVNIDNKNSADKKPAVILYNTSLDKKKLIYIYSNEKEEDDENKSTKFIYHDNFDLKKNINYMSDIENIGIFDLFSSDILIQEKCVRNYYELDFQYMNNRVTGYMYLMQHLINLLFINKFINKEEFNYYTQRHSSRYRTEINNFNETCQALIENLAKNYCGESKNETEKELQIKMQVIEQLPPKADGLINIIIHSQNSQARDLIDKLKHNNQISEDEADKICNMYLQNAEVFEHQLGKYKNAMNSKNEERLQNLDFKLKGIILNGIQNFKSYNQRESVLDSEALAKIENLSQSERDKIIKKYKEDVNNIMNKHLTEMNSQNLILTSKFKNDRKKELTKIFNYRDSELQKISGNFMKYSLEDFDTFFSSYQEAQENIDADLFNIVKKMDQLELDEYFKLKHVTDQSINSEIIELELGIIEQNCLKLSIDSRVTQNILDNHEKNLDIIYSSLEEEKAKQMKQMNEVLKARKLKRSELMKEIQTILNEEHKHKAIFRKTVDNHLIMPNEFKSKILANYKSNSTAIKIQIESIKIRQHKLMELESSKRIEIKMSSQKNLTNSQLSETPANLKSNEVDLYEDIIKQFEQEKRRIILESRDKQIEKTKAALKQQEDYIVAIMAKYMVGQFQEIKRKKNIENLYQSLLNEMNKKVINSFSAGQIMDQLMNEKMYIEQQRNSFLQKQKEQLEKVLLESKKKLQSEKKTDLQKRYIEQLVELQKNGASKEVVEFVDLRLTEKVTKSQEDAENEAKQQIIDEAEANKIDEARFEKKLNNQIIEALSKFVQVSNMSKTEIIGLINKTNPKIDDTTKNQIVREIYKKQGKMEISQHLFPIADDKDDYKESPVYKDKYNESYKDDFDDDNNLSKRKRTKRKKRRIKSEFPNDGRDEDEF